MPIRVPTSEEAREIGRKGGKASAEARARKKTIAEYLKVWAEQEPNAKNKAALEQLGLGDEATNKAAFVIPLIKKIQQGDIKALQMAIELLGEDRKKEAEIEKLKQEIELLKSGAGVMLEPVVVVNDVKRD